MLKGYTHLSTLKEQELTAQRQRQIEDIYKKFDPKILEIEILSQHNSSNQRMINQIQDQVDYLRGDFNAKLTNKAISDKFIDTHSDVLSNDCENVFQYIDQKISNMHSFLNTDYVDKIQNLIKIETSKLGEEIAQDIN